MKKYHKLNVRISFYFLILIAISAIFLGFVIYQVNYYISLNTAEKQLARCGKYVDQIVNSEMVDNWLNKGEDSAYKLTQVDLEVIKNEFELSYLFVYCPVLDKNNNIKNEAVYLFDINPDYAKKEQRRKLGDHDYDLKEYEDFRKTIETGEVCTTPVLSNEIDGNLMTTLVPLSRDNGKIYGVVGICRRIDTIKSVAVTSSILMVALFELAIIIFGILMLMYTHLRIIKPVKLLSNRMDKFVSSGREISFEPVTEIKTHDEIENMADNFNTMADSMVKYTADLKHITASRERLKAELDVAGSIRSAVSADMTVPAFSDRTDFELYASLKNTVYNSCSFCNYFMTDEDHLLIVMGESVGKTLPSMLMSMLAATNISAFAMGGKEPYIIAYETNNSLCGIENKDISMTVSALIAEIDLSRGEMKYVNAGMPQLIIKRTGEEYAVEEDTIQFNLGEMHGVSFVQKTIHLNQGNVLFFASYGVSEMKNPEGEKFTSSRLVDEINDIAKQSCDLKEMTGRIEGRLDNFRRGAQSELDTTILGFRYFG